MHEDYCVFSIAITKKELYPMDKDQVDNDSKIYITPLGAGNEVGRSCIHMKYRDTEILLDCGIHPAYTGQSSLPFFDLIDLSKVDAVLVTHFHLDHGGALPFLTEKTGFCGDVYMTHPTKTILKWLLNDYIRLLHVTSDTDIFTDEDLASCTGRIKAIDYYQEIRIKNFRITALNAGHVLGAAMFLIEVGLCKILYTGDYSREEDRHLRAADLPTKKINILICESTYGVGCHLPKRERESRFIGEISRIVNKGGRCLLPVFALGRAQELLLILEEHWETHRMNVPIYYVSALAKKCMNVYQTYLNMMNERIQKIGETKNPFVFNHVKNIQTLSQFEDRGSCVMVASPGMLQSGVSRELFERWCESEANGTIITGYCVPGTLAKEILSEPTYVQSMNGQRLALRMSVSFISFSAHVDFIQNSAFIEHCSPEHLILVHGEVNEMTRLRNAIQHKHKDMEILLLRNGECGVFSVEEEIRAKVPSGRYTSEFDGILVFRNDEAEVLDPSVGVRFVQKLAVRFNSTPALVRRALMCYFDDDFIENDAEIRVKDIKVTIQNGIVCLEWEGGYVSDVLAMSITRVVTSVEENVESVRYCKMSKGEALLDVLKNHFCRVEQHGYKMVVSDGVGEAEIENGVVSGNERVKDIVEELMRRLDSVFS